MEHTSRRTSGSLFFRRSGISIAITGVLLVVITVLDYITDPMLDLTIAYFVPITFAALTVGRWLAFTSALVAEVETCIDQADLVNTGIQSGEIAVSAIVVKILIYLFVAEVTSRLAKSDAEARHAAADLDEANEELRATNERLDDDVRTAGLLQERLFSFDPLIVEGCEVGAKVLLAGPTGGDFADVGTIDGLVYVCIADIAGKGTPAALFTSLLRHLLKDSHRRGLRGGNVLSTVNSALCRSMPTERFITLFYAEIDPASGRVEYVNAGHPEGLLYRGDRDEFEMVKPTAPLLGIKGLHPNFATSALQMRPGDSLTLYTDGATESKATAGDRIGEEPIRQLAREYSSLSAQEMSEQILASIEEATVAGSRDDLSIVCVKITR